MHNNSTLPYPPTSSLITQCWLLCKPTVRAIGPQLSISLLLRVLGQQKTLGGPSRDKQCAAQDASREQVERMEHKCAVCWAEMGTPLERAQRRLLGAGAAHVGRGGLSDDGAGEAPPGKALPCGHAFHEACIQRWLAQCHGRAPACLRRPSTSQRCQHCWDPVCEG